jgi:predicted nucleic acid-binding protein
MIVVDASIALKWVVNEPDSDLAEAVKVEALAAPDLWLAEAAKALWAAARRGRLRPDEPAAMIERLSAAPIEDVPLRALAASALRIARMLDHAAYDCFYLALALARDTHVVTADRRFVAAADARAETKGRVRPLVPAPGLTPPAA